MVSNPILIFLIGNEILNDITLFISSIKFVVVSVLIMAILAEITLFIQNSNFNALRFSMCTQNIFRQFDESCCAKFSSYSIERK